MSEKGRAKLEAAVVRGQGHPAKPPGELSDWEDRVRRSKFAGLSRYGREPRGHIALQDHGDWVAYRNIRVRPIARR